MKFINKEIPSAWNAVNNMEVFDFDAVTQLPNVNASEIQKMLGFLELPIKFGFESIQICLILKRKL